MSTSGSWLHFFYRGNSHRVVVRVGTVSDVRPKNPTWIIHRGHEPWLSFYWTVLSVQRTKPGQKVLPPLEKVGFPWRLESLGGILSGWAHRGRESSRSCDCSAGFPLIYHRLPSHLMRSCEPLCRKCCCLQMLRRAALFPRTSPVTFDIITG